MIKLNNKNITYVALADTNNSLKAPKEIWYADSSNSVKLVYRRKDALIEGIDYEKYHWLKGDGTAYIELDNQFNTDGNAFIDAHLKQYAQRSSGYDIIIGNNQSEDGYCIRITFASANFYDLHKVVNGVANSYRLTKTRDDMEHNVHLSFSSIEFDGVGSTIVWSNQFDSIMRNKFTRIYSGYAQYGEITMRSNNKEFLLTPCRLLRPIPASLDGNGIARQAGECGMWDKVSNKFYGNVASSGTFTVKGPKCYEEYKWLIADIPISTNMMTLPVNSDTLYFKRIWKSFGNSSYFLTDKYDYYTYFYQKKVSIYDSVGSDILGHFGSTINVDEVIEVDSNSERMIIHNVEVPKYGFPIASMRLNNGSSGVDSVTHYTSVISVNGVERYIPCKLTHGIPASMDANGITRPAGTCGMWDKVNDVFYGNVASSGSFTVSND